MDFNESAKLALEREIEEELALGIEREGVIEAGRDSGRVDKPLDVCGRYLGLGRGSGPRPSCYQGQ